MREGVLGVVWKGNREEVLLIKRRDVPVWVLPGGGIDMGETPEQAVVRELKEETGLTTTVSSKLAEYSPINRFTACVHLFECRSTQDNLAVGSETHSIAYFPINQLPKSLFPYHREWIERAAQAPDNFIKEPMSTTTFYRILSYYALRPWYALRYFMSRVGFPLNT